ncbi:hypothetical protein D3C87_1603280 [compost metagenome]
MRSEWIAESSTKLFGELPALSIANIGLGYTSMGTVLKISRKLSPFGSGSKFGLLAFGSLYSLIKSFGLAPPTVLICGLV